MITPFSIRLSGDLKKRTYKAGKRRMVPLGLNYIRIGAHCSFIGRCLRYFIRP
ncbi:hypothetical protein T09_5125 [Trichinella sp. T9]|nr:hypothetical protein T09_5125 [Trichinella sp. T9]